MPDGKTILSWELSIVLNEFKSFLLIFGSDDMIYLTIAIFRWFSKQPSPLNGMVGGNHRIPMVFDACPTSVKRSDAMDHRSSLAPLQCECVCVLSDY